MALQPSNGACLSASPARSSSSLTKCRASSSTVPESGELNRGIAKLYDSSSGLWEDIWGEHMHHGFYDLRKSGSDHKAAQVRMIEEALAWANIPEDEENKPRNILDVGCGIGGSARFLAKKYSANVKGITLSPVQAERAAALTSAQGLSDKVTFEVADALNQPFPDGQFDLVWSMESGEHMPNKLKFMQELVRVAAPKGRLLIVTWCHRELIPGETSLNKSEQDLLKKICDAYYLPDWCPASEYVKLGTSLGLEDIKSEDWTPFITPFWPAVIASALSFKGIVGLLRSGWTTIRGALAMFYMVQGYKTGLIKFSIISGRKVSS